ncbi:hypothetical protein [Pseudomonas psychrophila]|uniref:hypothetical protein n=1 Tax=Pseudomonas psychrophila TaxID=122355 RepID=UPI000315C12B|nr:hypothetical protein [Pseudomonas psychrophila]
MGKLLRLRGVTITDSSAPKLITRDRIESAGSLFLFDGNHQFGAFAGLPAQNAAIPNVLANKAAALLGVAESAVGLVVGGGTVNSAYWKSERTTKGGVHGIITQAGGQIGNPQYRIKAATAIRDYVLANPTHKYYASIWSRITRQSLATSSQSPMHFIGATTANMLFNFESGLPSPLNGATLLGRKPDPVIGDLPAQPLAAPYNRFGSIGVQGVVGTGPGAGTDINLLVGTDGAWAGGMVNKAPSRIIYRGYMEDLTASGRDYAEVEAIDYAMFLEAFGVGGKFYGDTYTSPATLP